MCRTIHDTFPDSIYVHDRIKERAYDLASSINSYPVVELEVDDNFEELSFYYKQNISISLRDVINLQKKIMLNKNKPFYRSTRVLSIKILGPVFLVARRAV